VIGRPETSEHVPYLERYISLVSGENILTAFDSETRATRALLDSISDEKSLHRYDPAKWSIREAWVHLLDSERVFAYRALRFARADEAAVEGFEPDEWVEPSAADARSWPSIRQEYEDVRRATVAFVRNLPPPAWLRSGVAGGGRVSVRALAYTILGHDIHHRTQIRERYL
jgi:uncharacterized damage-inducible protein DinB